MARKSILWKTIKEFNPDREEGSLLVACIEIDGKKIIKTIRYSNKEEKFESLDLMKILYNYNEPGKADYTSTGTFIETDTIIVWCYLDEFLSGMSL